MLSPNKFQIGSKASPTSPPTKLLINHGKPNYTIPRTKNYQKYHVDETDNNEVAKIILKKSIIRNTNATNVVNNSDSSDKSCNNVEFLQKHQKIAKKLSIGRNEYNEVNQHNNFEQGDCEFLRKHKKIVTDGTNSNGNPNSVNGFPPLRNGEAPICFKPYQPKTNGTLTVRTDLKVNGAGTENKAQQKPEIKQKPLNTPPIPIMQNKISATNEAVDMESGPNFEQKTIVSFSRELAQPNKYLDTVKTAEERPFDEANNQLLMGMAQIKFDIKEDHNEDLIVTPVIR